MEREEEEKKKHLNWKVENLVCWRNFAQIYMKKKSQ